MAITFVIPVRHHSAVPDWDGVCQRLAQTVESVRRQSVEHWRCVVVANSQTPLPDLPGDIDVVRVDLPQVVLPDWEGGAREKDRNEAVRADKGARVLAGILAVPSPGHVMVVDYDDFVSCRLAELSSTEPMSAGWVVDSGYVYDGGPFSYLKTAGFNGLCGSSLIVHTRLLGLKHGADTDHSHVRRTLGSHVFLADDLASSGTPLARCPFPAAVYRVGVAGSVSGSPTVRRFFFRRRLLVSRPLAFVRRLSNVRLSWLLLKEFGVPQRGSRGRRRAMTG